MAAFIGYGSTVEVETAAGSGVYFELEQVLTPGTPQASVDQVDVTHTQSPGRRREFIPGLTDSGSATMQLIHDPASATDVFIEAWRASGEVRDIRLTYPNAAVVEFSGSVENYNTDIPLDDKITAEFSVKVSGAVTIVPPAVPANTVIPAVAGIAQTGQVLTALPGLWTGAPSFAYQWQQDTAGNGTFVNISGATARTYTVVSGNQTNRIRVGLTGTNGAGSSSQVFSAPTVAVIP